MEKAYEKQKPQKSFNFELPLKVNEKDVGIECYLNNKDAGFECVIKHRFSDFIVNEIDENGNVIWLIEKETKDKIKIVENIENSLDIDETIKEIPKQHKISISNDIELNLENYVKIIDENFKGEILDEEDSFKLCDLIYRYINR